jgi:hypothetical protein
VPADVIGVGAVGVTNGCDEDDDDEAAEKPLGRGVVTGSGARNNDEEDDEEADEEEDEDADAALGNVARLALRGAACAEGGRTCDCDWACDCDRCGRGCALLEADFAFDWD